MKKDFIETVLKKLINFGERHIDWKKKTKNNFPPRLRDYLYDR